MTRRSDSLLLWRWTWITFMVLATSVPYLINYFSAPPASRYTWILPPYPEDSLGYMAWSQQATHGSLLFKLKYTAVPCRPFLFHPFFLVCGFVSSLLGGHIGVIHWIARAIGVVVFFLVFFRFISDLGLNRHQSMIATILVGVSSGCGWFAMKFGIGPNSSCYPVDLWLVDSNTYWSLLWNPLYPWSLALLVFSIHLMDRGTRTGEKRDLRLSGFCVAILSLIHPYQVPLLFALATLITIFRQRKEALRLLPQFLYLALPVALGMFLLDKLNPVATMHSATGKMVSANPLAYVLGFGLPLFLSLAGLAAEWRKLLPRYWHLVLWVVLSISFSYLPFWFQRKLIFGAHVPLCILAGISADRLLARIPGRRMRRWALAGSGILLLPLAVATQGHLLATERDIVKQNKDELYYVDTDLLDALNYLKHNSNPDDVVFATWPISSLIPAFSGNTVVWGHFAMCVDLQQRIQWATNLFGTRSPWNPEKRHSEFWGTGIRFVLVNQELRRWFDQTHTWSLLDGTDKVFENTSIAVYRKRNMGNAEGTSLRSPHEGSGIVSDAVVCVPTCATS